MFKKNIKMINTYKNWNKVSYYFSTTTKSKPLKTLYQVL